MEMFGRSSFGCEQEKQTAQEQDISLRHDCSSRVPQWVGSSRHLEEAPS